MSDHGFQTFICMNCGAEHKAPVYCKDRFCPICSKRRAGIVSSKIRYLLTNARRIPGYRLKHLVLTIQNYDDPREAANHLVTSFRKFRNRQIWKSHVHGGVFTLEFTRSNGQWHAHIHALIMARYFPIREIVRHWEKCSRGRICFIKEVKSQMIADYLASYVVSNPITGPENTAHADTNMPCDASISHRLHGLRLFQCFGSWSNIKIKLTKYAYNCESCGASEWYLDKVFDILINRARRYGRAP